MEVFKYLSFQLSAVIVILNSSLHSATADQNVRASSTPTIEQHNMTAGNDTSEYKGVSKWIILAPAIPTVFIFVIVVLLIALKNHITDRYSFDRSLPDLSIDDKDGESASCNCFICCGRKEKIHKASKEDYKKELYDHMWKDWQEQRGLKSQRGQRKSSQIILEGFSSSSPRTLARKHLALTNMNSDDSNRRPSAVGVLIKMSSKAAMASTIIEAEEERLNSKDSGDEKQCLLPPKDTKRLSFRELPLWQQEDMKKIEEESNESDFEHERETDKKGKKMSRTGSSSSFKYRKLSRQSKVNAEDSDSDGSYDCAQHIQTILATNNDADSQERPNSRNESKKRRKVTQELLPDDLEGAMADVDVWPESAM